MWPIVEKEQEEYMKEYNEKIEKLKSGVELEKKIEAEESIELS